MPRIPLPTNRRSTMVAGIALVTMVASVGATMTGAVRPVRPVRPARPRAGRLYRAPSGVSVSARRTLPNWSNETTMAAAIEIIRAVDSRSVEDVVFGESVAL